MTWIALFATCQSDSVKCYNKSELQAIALKLIEGKECSELLETYKTEVSILNEQKKELIQVNTNLETNLVKTSNNLTKEKNRKKVWRGLTIGAGGIIASLILIISL